MDVYNEYSRSLTRGRIGYLSRRGKHPRGDTRGVAFFNPGEGVAMAEVEKIVMFVIATFAETSSLDALMTIALCDFHKRGWGSCT